MIALIRNTCQKGKDVINTEKVLKVRSRMEELPGRNQSIKRKAETTQFVPLSSGTGLDSKLLYHEDKRRYLDILKFLTFLTSRASFKLHF